MVNPSLILVALGANLPSAVGDPADTLRAALRIMHGSGEFAIAALSHFWMTPAHPPGSGPDYCNAAAVLRTDLTPGEVLARLHRIEAELGRTRTPTRWQSRVIDLDLIACQDLVLPDNDTQDAWRLLAPSNQALRAPEGLILPHPRMQDRGFVLAPLAEIAPGWIHPRTGLTVSTMLKALNPALLHEMHILGRPSRGAAS